MIWGRAFNIFLFQKNMNKMSDNIRIILISIGVVIISSFVFYNCGASKEKKSAEVKNNQNVAAMNSKLELYKNKLGEITSSRASLALDLDRLESVNKELSERIKYAEHKVISLNKINLEFEKKYSDLSDDYNALCEICEIDKNRIRDGIYGDILSDSLSAFIIKWNLFNGPSDSLHFDISGATIFNGRIDTLRDMSGQDSFKISILNASNRLESIKFGLKVYSGIEYDEEKELYKSTVSTADSNVKLDVEGWISPDVFFREQKRWHIGPYVGIGIGIPLESGLIQIPNVNFGIGLTYSLFSF